MLTLENMSALCSLLQIAGFILIVFWAYLPSYTGALISVAGFASVVKVLLPYEGSQDALTMVAAFAGLGLIYLGVLKARVN